jgi:hypothetical protein
MAVMRRLLMALSFWNRLYPFSLHLRRNSKGEPSETGAFQWVPMRMRVLHRAPLANNRGNLILERAANLRDAPILRIQRVWCLNGLCVGRISILV